MFKPGAKYIYFDITLQLQDMLKCNEYNYNYFGKKMIAVRNFAITSYCMFSNQTMNDDLDANERNTTVNTRLEQKLYHSPVLVNHYLCARTFYMVLKMSSQENAGAKCCISFDYKY